MMAEANACFECRYWRMPSYVMAKFVLGTASGLFIG